MRRFAAALVALLLLAVSQAGSPALAGAAPLAARQWQDESIYFLMTDRFANGDPSNDGDARRSNMRAWHGGDLRGVLNKLDYIKSLGFTAIWITPHVKNSEWDYHGYGAVDFFDVDPHFGTVADLKQLVQQAHAREMRVIFDMVLNHTGPNHPLVKEKPDWFHPAGPIENWEDQKQLQERWLFNLPDFDQSRPGVKEYILEYSKHWIEQTGVDGFRIDTLRHLPPEFVAWYAAELQKVKPGFWLLGESWESKPEKLAVYQKAGVPALLDFPLNEAVRAAIGGDESMTRLAAAVESVGRIMPDPTQMGAFIDNHDMERFASITWTDPVRRLKLALTFLFAQRDIPIVYYGTEIAMEGGKDPDNRRDFPWGKEKHQDVTDLVRRLNEVRQGHPALRRGSVVPLTVTDTAYAFGRVAEGEKVLVVINNHESEAVEAVDVAALGLADGTVLHDAITGQEVTVAGGKALVGLGARSGAIYVPGPAAGVTPLAPWVSEPPNYWAWASLALVNLAFVGAFVAWRLKRRYDSRPVAR